MSKTVQVRPDLTVKMEPLSIKESFQADNVASEFSADKPDVMAGASISGKVYILCAIRKVNDVPVAPLAGGAAFEGLMDKFTLQELQSVLQPAYYEISGLTKEALKNESSAEG